MSGWEVSEDRMSVDHRKDPDADNRHKARLFVAGARQRGVILSDEEMVQHLDMLGLLDVVEAS